MREAAVAAALLSAAAACSGAGIELAQEPTSRASQCSAVEALSLEERRAEEAAEVSFEDFTRILHPAMIHAARAEGSVDLRQLMTISQNAPIAMEEYRGRNWRSLVEPCAQAFPETRRNAGELPPDSFQAGMICFGLADFLARTASDHPREQQSVTALADRALAAATPVLTQRSGGNDDALQIADRFMARAFLAGTPASVLDQCARRFAVRAG